MDERVRAIGEDFACESATKRAKLFAMRPLLTHICYCEIYVSDWGNKVVTSLSDTGQSGVFASLGPSLAKKKCQADNISFALGFFSFHFRSQPEPRALHTAMKVFLSPTRLRQALTSARLSNRRSHHVWASSPRATVQAALPRAVGATTSPTTSSRIQHDVYNGINYHRHNQPRHLSSYSAVEVLPDDIPHTGPLWDAYYQLLKNADVHADEHQTAALESLERLRLDLLHYQPPKDIITGNDSDNTPSTSSGFGGWFSLGGSSSSSKTSKAAVAKAPRGVYLHGGVGCGKTFCMNLFYDAITTGPFAADKQKIHFHKFMLQVHQAMHMARKNSNAKLESDAILPAVIAETVQQGRLICLDEFQGQCCV